MPAPPQLSVGFPVQGSVQAPAPLVGVAAAGLVKAAQHSSLYSTPAYGYGGTAAWATSRHSSTDILELLRILVSECGEESLKHPT
jgi:hypothetical protein